MLGFLGCSSQLGKYGFHMLSVGIFTEGPITGDLNLCIAHIVYHVNKCFLSSFLIKRKLKDTPPPIVFLNFIKVI